MKPVLTLFLTVMLVRTDALAQENWRAGAYRNVSDFANREPVDSFGFNTYARIDKFVPELFSIKTKESQISNEYLKYSILLIYTGNVLFINLKPLKIANGFVRVSEPGRYNFFMGRPRKNEFNETQFVAALTNGLIGTAMQGGLKDETRKSVPYVFNIETGKLYPFIPATLDRLTESYPALFEAYRMEPSRKDLKTMKVYLGILNEMIATEVK